MAGAYAIDDAVRTWMRRLDGDVPPTPEERAALAAALAAPFAFRAHQVLARAGGRDPFALLVVEGLVARVKETGAGQRQIVSVLLPGDICAAGLAFVLPLDYGLVALSDGRAARLSQEAIKALQAAAPRMMLPLARSLAEEAAITREWVANVGARNGGERIAHLLCELRWRLEAVGLAGPGVCRIPISQRDIAQAVGLSAVQTNRLLGRFCKAGLIAVGRGCVDVLEPARLGAVGVFDPYYLEVREAAAQDLAWQGVQFSS